jgi:uncharacterized OB-fold protein
VEYLKIPDDGDPYLEGFKCGACGATFLGERNVCSKCGARDQLSAVTLPTAGNLYSYCIVHRSFPGVEVPYVSAIVDLEDGTAIKGNLINVEAQRPRRQLLSFLLFSTGLIQRLQAKGKFND